MDERNDRARRPAESGRTEGEGSERAGFRAGPAGGSTEPGSESNRSTGNKSASDAARKASEAASAAADKAKSKLADVADKAEMPGPMLSSVLGALAGSVGGWWMGRSEPDEDSGYTADDERHYREHFESHERPGVTYGEARTGYLLGHLAARNPEYDGRDFKDIESDLRHGFRGQHGARFDVVSDYAKHAYERRSSGVMPALLGAVAGALGGWWAANSRDTASKMPAEEETAHRTHFSSNPPRSAGLTYESARPGYTLGYLAARNPSYEGRQFEEIEPELRRGFAGEHATQYDSLRDYARHAYERGRGGGKSSR